MMRISGIFLVLVGLFLPVAVRGQDANKDDLGKLQGQWTLKSYLFNGAPPSPQRKPAERLQIDSDKSFHETQEGKVVTRGTFTIDASQSPKHITAAFQEGGPTGGPVKGIYELKGDTLRVCVGTPELDRPTKFESPAGAAAADRL